MADLFTFGDLASYLKVPQVDNETATRARRTASGWLRSATGVSDWPDPVPDDLFGWALELAAMVYTNPEGLASRVIGATTDTWPLGRRREILDAARAAYSTAGRPQYSFPEPDWHWTSVATVTD